MYRFSGWAARAPVVARKVSFFVTLPCLHLHLVLQVVWLLLTLMRDSLSFQLPLRVNGDFSVRSAVRAVGLAPFSVSFVIHSYSCHVLVLVLVVVESIK